MRLERVAIPVPTPTAAPRLDDAAPERAAREHAQPVAPLGVGTGRHRLGLGSGRELPTGRFGAGLDLSTVRVHADDGASTRLTKDHDADALAVGSDLIFAPGRYRPGTPAGDELIRHELTHLAQQAESGTAVIQRHPRGQHGPGPGSTAPREPFDTVRDGSLGTEDDFVTFAQDSVDLGATFPERFQTLLRNHAGPVTVELHGYTSTEGNGEYNMNLSAQRAAAVGRAVQSLLPAGSVVRLYAHGQTSGFGDTADPNRRVGIDISDRVSLATLTGTPEPRTPFGPLQLTLDARLLPPPTQPAGPTTPRAPGFTFPTTSVLPRLPQTLPDPADVARELVGPTVAPRVPLTPGPTIGLDWSLIHETARTRGTRLTVGDQAFVMWHYRTYYPLAQLVSGARSLLPRFLHKSAADIMTDWTRSAVDAALATERPNASETALREAERLRAILGLEPLAPLSLPNLEWRF